MSTTENWLGAFCSNCSKDIGGYISDKYTRVICDECYNLLSERERQGKTGFENTESDNERERQADEASALKTPIVYNVALALYQSHIARCNTDITGQCNADHCCFEDEQLEGHNNDLETISDVGDLVPLYSHFRRQYEALHKNKIAAWQKTATADTADIRIFFQTQK